MFLRILFFRFRCSFILKERYLPRLPSSCLKIRRNIPPYITCLPIIKQIDLAEPSLYPEFLQPLTPHLQRLLLFALLNDELVVLLAELGLGVLEAAAYRLFHFVVGVDTVLLEEVLAAKLV